MNRRVLGLTLLGGIVAILLTVWIANRTEWAEVEVPMPPKGEALTNPTYAAQRFVERLGARASRDRLLNLPPPTGVVVVSAWNWGLIAERASRLEKWVESGGRLVIDITVVTDDEFERWSGISWAFRETGQATPNRNKPPEPCRRFDDLEGAAHWLCDTSEYSHIVTSRRPDWLLRHTDQGIQAVRVRIGAGSITVVNNDPFRFRKLFDGDHGWLLVSAAQLRSGDEVHFLSEADYPTLLALIWQYGAPAVILFVAFIALWVWRAAVRLMPVDPAPTGARRSLAEQIRGTGAFIARHGGTDALHASTVRALEEAARSHVPGYAALPVRERIAALANLTDVSADALTDAMFHATQRQQRELPTTIALLETARRRLLSLRTTQTKGIHGTA